MKLLSYLPVILLSGFLASVGTTSETGNDGMYATAGVKIGNGSLVPSQTAISWSPYMVGVWNLDEGGASTRVNTGACGGTASNCNLSRSGTPTNDTTYFKQGTGSNTFDGTGDYVSCANATCSALSIKSNGSLHTGSISYGCWSTLNGSTGNRVGAIMGKHDGTYGYELWIDYGVAVGIYATAKCQIDSYTTWLPSYSTLLTAQKAPNLNHYVCTYDDASATQSIIVNGSYKKDLGAPGYPTLTNRLTSNTTDFKIGSSGVKGDFYGYADECFVYNGVLSERDACRICSCGMDGALCACGQEGQGTWDNTGRRDTDCGGCTLPASCFTPPGVD